MLINRPRKRHQFLTPNEVFAAVINNGWNVAYNSGRLYLIVELVGTF